MRVLFLSTVFLYSLCLPAISAFSSTTSCYVPARGRSNFCRLPLSGLPEIRPKSRAFLNLAASIVSDSGINTVKSELLDVIAQTNMGSIESADAAKQIDTLINQLAVQSCQFDPKVADGEWALVFTRNADGSPLLQRATQKVEKLGGSFANFAVEKGEFYNIAEILGGSGTLTATVAFGMSEENAGKRITCEIVDAGIKLWSLPRIPLPLRAKGGWLDFLYLDEVKAIPSPAL